MNKWGFGFFVGSIVLFVSALDVALWGEVPRAISVTPNPIPPMILMGILIFWMHAIPAGLILYRDIFIWDRTQR